MYGDSMPGETMHTLASNDKAYHMLGWSPTVDILQWLEEQH